MSERRIEIKASDSDQERIALIREQYDIRSDAEAIREALRQESTRIRCVRVRDGQPTYPRGWEHGNPNKAEKGGTE